MRASVNNEDQVDDLALTPTDTLGSRKFLKRRNFANFPSAPPISPVSPSPSPRFFGNRKPSVKNVKGGIKALPELNLMEESDDDGTRKVRFNETRNVSTMVAVNGKYAQQCWYTHEEYQCFKFSAKALVREISLDTSAPECKYRRVISSVLNTCCAAEFEISPSTTSGSILCEKDRQEFARCLVKSTSRFGLERTIVCVLKDDSLSRKRLALRRVQALQKISETPTQARADMIRLALEPISLPSRWFALEKAKAQQTLSRPL